MDLYLTDNRVLVTNNEVERNSVGSKRPQWGWDYAFVFSKTEDTVTNQEKTEIIARLKRAGFVFSQIASEVEGIVILRFSLPADKLKENAEHLSLDVELKSKFGGGHMDFRRDLADCFVNDLKEKETGSYFSPSDRVIIILRTLESRENWGCALDISKLVLSEVLKQAFAIHSPKLQKELIQKAVWDELWNPLWIPPYKHIKDYLGSRVGFYFSFVSLLARYLIPMAITSIVVFACMQVFSERIKILDSLTWFYGILIVLWASVFLEILKRRSAELVLDWGTYDYYSDTADEIRAQFKGPIRPGFYSAGGFVSLEDIVKHTDDSEETDKRTRIISALTERFDLGIFGANDSLSDRENERAILPMNAYDDGKKTRKYKAFSIVLTMIFIVLVAGITFFLLWYRNEIICGVQGFSKAECKCHFSVSCEVPEDDSFLKDVSFIANAIPGILNGVVIAIFDALWPKMSSRLTDRENHRTTQSYENSYVYKYFAFQFFSNYASLFYIAFISRLRTNNNICRLRRNSINNLLEPDCMRELEMQMVSLLLTKTVIQQVMEVGMPLIKNLFTWWMMKRSRDEEAEKHTAPTASDASRYVKESKMPPYPSTVQDYSEMVLQFGYFVLFGVSFPLAAVVMLINNIIEVRTDAFKILKVFQRVNADRAADIGAWYIILRLLVTLSVITNSALLIFTAETGNTLFSLNGKISDELKILTFFLLMNSLFVGRKVIELVINDVPSRTRRKLARQKYEIARNFDIGWENSYRGNALFNIDDHEIEECEKLNQEFDEVSEDELDGSVENESLF